MNQSFKSKRNISKLYRISKEIIRRRTKFDLDKALARAHILEGLRIALRSHR